MSHAMRLDLGWSGLGGAIRNLDQLADRYDRIAKTQAKLNAMGGGGRGGSGGGSGGGGRGGSGVSGGPNARLAGAQSRLQSLLQRGGSDADVEDARGALQRAQAAAARQKEALGGGPGFGQRFMSLVGSTRLNLPGVGGVGASPLIGKMAGLLGLAKFAGPIGLAVTGVTLFAQGVQSATEHLREFSGAMKLSGGTSGQVAGLAAMGIPLGDIPGLAGQFRQRSQAGSGDMGAQLGRARLGLGPVGNRMFGKQNEAGDLKAAAESLRTIYQTKGAEEALRVARMTGLESLLQYASVSNEVAAAMRKDGQVMASVMDERSGRSAGDLGANFKRLLGNSGTALTAAFKPFIEPLNRFVGWLADLARMAGQYINSGPGRILSALGRLVGAFMALNFKVQGKGLEAMMALFEKFTPLIESFAKMIDLLADQMLKAAGLDPATLKTQDAHTQAMMDHTKALREGTYGGGARARAALGPSAMKGEMRRRAMEQQALDMSHWTG